MSQHHVVELLKALRGVSTDDLDNAIALLQKEASASPESQAKPPKKDVPLVPEVMELPAKGVNLEEMLETVERSLIEAALARTNGNVTEAAHLLGISFRSIRYRIVKLGMGEE